MSDAERATFDRVCNSLACAGSDIVRVLTLRQNRGKGYAVKTGMMHARGKYLLMVDADGATRIGECETPRRQSSCLCGASRCARACSQALSVLLCWSHMLCTADLENLESRLAQYEEAFSRQPQPLLNGDRYVRTARSRDFH